MFPRKNDGAKFLGNSETSIVGAPKERQFAILESMPQSGEIQTSLVR